MKSTHTNIYNIEIGWKKTERGVYYGNYDLSELKYFSRREKTSEKCKTTAAAAFWATSTCGRKIRPSRRHFVVPDETGVYDRWRIKKKLWLVRLTSQQEY